MITTKTRNKIEKAIEDNSLLRKRRLYLVPTRAYCRLRMEIPKKVLMKFRPSSRRKAKEALTFCFRHCWCRCGLMDLNTGKVVLNAANYEELALKVEKFKPQEGGFRQHSVEQQKKCSRKALT